MVTVMKGMDMSAKISREEAVRRLLATKEAKRQRMEVLKERMKKKYKDAMGVEPNTIFFL